MLWQKLKTLPDLLIRCFKIMAQITITINSREYAIACEDGQELHIMQLSRMLDEKAKLLGEGANQISEGMLLAMVGLLLADELSELKKMSEIENYEIKELQVDIIKQGKLVYKMPTLAEIKAYAQSELESFWDEYKRLDRPHVYKVDLSDGLYQLKRDMLDEIRGKQIK